MKIGLKLWSDNDFYMKSAERLYENGHYDFIELYIVPGSVPKYSGLWKELNIPCIIHAAHYAHGVNLAERSKREFNKPLIREAQTYADKLDAEYIIMHCGILGDKAEVIEQLKMIGDERILIENKPFKSLDSRVCAGSSPDEIELYRKNAKVGFCFDVSHAISYAASSHKPYLEAIKDFLALKPVMIHMGGMTVGSEVDKHIHLRQSNCDLREIMGLINKNIDSIKYCTLETSKDSQKDLNDFVEDVNALKELMKVSI